MYSELVRIPIEAGGLKLFGFGLLLWVWLGVVVLWLLWARRDPRRWAETLAQWPLFLVVTGILIGVPAFFPEGLPIRSYGVMLLIGASTGLVLAVYRAGRAGIDADTIFSLAFWMFVAGIAGARAFFVIEYWQRSFAHLSLRTALVEALKFTNGGLVVYGALIGATVAFILYTRHRRLPVLAVADIIAPSLVVGLAFGRIGCLLYGCCFGGLCNLPWAVTFPPESAPYESQLQRGLMHGMRLVERDGRLLLADVVPGSAADAAGLEPGQRVTSVDGQGVKALDEGLGLALARAYYRGEPVRLTAGEGRTYTLPPVERRRRSLPVHPTQIYSSINAALLAFFLWNYYPFRRRDGEVIGLLLTIYPVTRFLLEMIRTDEASFLGTGLTISQNISLLVLVIMVGFWFVLLRRPAGRVLETGLGESAAPPKRVA